MMIYRLIRWACRCKDLPSSNYDGTKRVPTFWEAVSGVSGT